MRTITKEEMEADLLATEKDIDRLLAITDALAAFIREPHGEDRSAFKRDLLKYDWLLGHARDLRDKIRHRL